MTQIKPLRTWTVQTIQTGEEKVQAHYSRVDDGHLVFLTIREPGSESSKTHHFASGSWVSSIEQS